MLPIPQPSTAGNTAEIHTRYLHNKTQGRYRYTNIFNVYYLERFSFPQTT